ncbi:MAG: hypothetical protein AAB960_00615 [Patescibacteria group bacterium]
MPKKPEVEFPCNECRFFVASPKREMKPFNDGKNYLVTGACDNPLSPLYQHTLTGSFTNIMNAMHHNLERISKLGCFAAKSA